MDLSNPAYELMLKPEMNPIRHQPTVGLSCVFLAES
jgi:hypothetical protein